MLPACQLANAADLAVDGAQARPIALAPDHALVIGRRDLAAPLNQGAVGIEEQLSVVQGSAVTLVDANGHNNFGLPGSFADGVRGRRRDRYRLIEQLPLLRSDDVLQGGLDEGELRVVRHHGLRKRGELYPLLTKLADLAHYFFDRSHAATGLSWTAAAFTTFIAISWCEDGH